MGGFANPFLAITIQNWRNLRVNDFDDLALFFHSLDINAPIRLAAHCSGAVELQELTLSAEQEKIEIGVGAQHMANGGNGSAQGTGSGGQAVDPSSSAVSVGPRVLRYSATVKPRQGEPWSFSNAIRVASGDNIQATEPLNPVSKQTIGNGRYMPVSHSYASDLIGNVIVQKKGERLVEFLQIINPRIANMAVKDALIKSASTSASRMRLQFSMIPSREISAKRSASRRRGCEAPFGRPPEARWPRHSSLRGTARNLLRHSLPAHF